MLIFNRVCKYAEDLGDARTVAYKCKCHWIGSADNAFAAFSSTPLPYLLIPALRDSPNLLNAGGSCAQNEAYEMSCEKAQELVEGAVVRLLNL